MSNIEVSRDVLFLGMDLSRPRWTVEQEKVHKKFSGFSFYGTNEKVTSIKGTLYTSYGNSYYIKIIIPDNYPYEVPKISLPHHDWDDDFPPHLYYNNNIPEGICIMKADQWSSAYSIAFVIAKTAKWLHKYDYWKREGVWPGREQEH